MTSTQPRAVYQRQLRARRRAAGLCVFCTAPAQGGTRMCWRHRLAQSALKYAKRQKRAGALQ